MEPVNDVVNAGNSICLKDVSDLGRIEVSGICNFLHRFLDGLLKLGPIDLFNIAQHFLHREFRYLRYRLEGLFNDIAEFFDIDLFGSQIRRSRRSGFVFPNDASIGEQCLCMHGLDLSMGMDDDHPMSMADGISHFLFNTKYFFGTVEIA